MEGLECQRQEFGLFSIIKGETPIFLDQESSLIKGMAVRMIWREEILKLGKSI